MQMFMTDLAISIRGLTKSYEINCAVRGKRVFGEVLMNRLRNPLARGEGTREFLALNDVSLDVKKGEVVGIIGRNGAGKSTLLKVLSRITEPTAGKIKLYGRVGSLLEVGTGFHPELTGRENIFLNGAILGMTRNEIRSRFDAIVDFSEVENFLDTPVKRFSSGMYVRLAFAVAAHLEPEILIVDEVLAVGDVAFQRKCLGKMDAVAKQGRTVLVVTHNMDLARQLFQRAVVLDGGRIKFQGNVSQAVAEYSRSGAPEAHRLPIGDHRFRLLAVSVRPADLVPSSQPIQVSMTCEILERCRSLRIGFDVIDADGSVVFRSFHDDWKPEYDSLAPGSFTLRGTIPADLLRPGQYSVSVEVGVHSVAWIVTRTLFVPFTVVLGDGEEHRHGAHRIGAVLPKIDWTVKSLNNA